MDGPGAVVTSVFFLKKPDNIFFFYLNDPLLHGINNTKKLHLNVAWIQYCLWGCLNAISNNAIRSSNKNNKKKVAYFYRYTFCFHIVVISKLHKHKSFLYLNFLISFYIVHIEPAVFKLNNLLIKKKLYSWVQSKAIK